MFVAPEMVSNQFSDRGLTINEGIAIDARIVKSASRRVSNKTLEKIKAKKETPEGKNTHQLMQSMALSLQQL